MYTNAFEMCKIHDTSNYFPAFGETFIATDYASLVNELDETNTKKYLGLLDKNVKKKKMNNSPQSSDNDTQASNPKKKKKKKN